MAGLAEARSQTWWLLSRFYEQRPEADWLAELRQTLETVAASAPVDHADAPDDQDAGEQAIHAEVHSLLDSLRGDDGGDLSTRLSLEYTRLFRGIEEHYGPPPPYEGIHRGQDLMGPIAMDVRRHYEAAGLGAIEPGSGPKDHLSVELRFLSLLCFREAEAWRAGQTESARQRIDQQRAFLDSHLLAWLPGYAIHIATESREPFYAAAARLTLRVAQQERAQIEQGRQEDWLETVGEVPSDHDTQPSAVREAA